MGIQDLQGFLESTTLEGGAVSVDLLKIARNIPKNNPHNPNRKRPLGDKLRLILDAENCLDRLYGGYFSDWACGGQWNRMVQFINLLTQAVDNGNIQLSVAFDGTIEDCRMNEWIAHQANIRQRVGMVLKHISTKATPPPKIWWTAPICLKTSLRMALRHLGIGVMCTMDDHHQEIIAYCREHRYDGLLADDAEYVAFDPPRYFSSTHIKLTYKGSLETKEFMVGELLKHLQLTKEQMCILSSLMGNFLLPENELQDVYRKVQATFGTKETNMQGEMAVKLIADYVRTLPPFSNLEALSKELFGSLKDRRCHLFKQSVLYYLNGTADGFLKYCAYGNKNQFSIMRNNFKNLIIKEEEAELDPSDFASETTEVEQESLQNYNLVKLKMSLSDMVTFETDNNAATNAKAILEDLPPSSDTSHFNGTTNGSYLLNDEPLPSCSSGSTRVNLLVSSESSKSGSGPQSPKNPSTANSNVITPMVSADVLRTASLRHQKGLMNPLILHALNNKEIRLPCVMEDESNRDFPSVHSIYLFLRQKIYAVLFNLHHHRFVDMKKKYAKEIPEDSPPPDIIIREWVYSRSNPYQTPIEVKANPLPWAVPTLQRLWFGPSIDDKRRRMRALLSCLSSDSPLILNISFVPQHMLVMACVLRYIMALEKPILRRIELDVFICTAFNPDLINTQYLQELTLNVVTSRGVQLAAIFMQGVEMALLANDACGAPLPWLMCCPWLFFDGKLFHHILTRSTHAKGLLDLCENRIERVVKVERMRKAIIEGIDVKYAIAPLPQFANHMRHLGIAPAGLSTMQLPSTRGNSNTRRSMSSRGGQLQIAGVVVGQWGANYGYQGVRPPIMSGYNRGGTNVGRSGPNNYVPPNFSHRGAIGGRGRKPGPLSFPVNNRKTQAIKKKGNKPKQNATNLNKENRENISFTGNAENGVGDVAEILKEQPSEKVMYLDTNDTKSTEQGQGDGPSVDTSG